MRQLNLLENPPFKKGDRVWYWSVSRIRDNKGERIVAKGKIIEIYHPKGLARIQRTDYEMPTQVIEIKRLKRDV